VLNDLRVLGAATVFDMATNDKGIDVDRDVIIDSGGTLRPPLSSPFTIQRDLVVQGAVDASSGTVEFDGVGTSRIDLSADTEIAGLEVYEPSKRLELDSAYRLTVSGATATTGLRVSGGACGTRVTLDTDTPGVPAVLDATGSDDVQYVLIDEVEAAAPGITALHAHPAGPATGWNIINGNCSAITVSAPGTVTIPSTTGGDDASASMRVTVTSDSNTGYQLWATDTSNTVSFDRPGPADVSDYPTISPAAPDTWSAGDSGSDGYGGVTVLDATGGRLAQWGAGAGDLTDYTDNQYLGLQNTTFTLLHEALAPVASDDIDLGIRLTAAPGSPPDSYSQSITFTALYKP
jgi:hypothetical protein